MATKHPGMDVVIVRENEEDLYAGNRAPQTNESNQCLKAISRPGLREESGAPHAFEYARANGRQKSRFPAFTKDNNQ